MAHLEPILVAPIIRPVRQSWPTRAGVTPNASATSATFPNASSGNSCGERLVHKSCLLSA